MPATAPTIATETPINLKEIQNLAAERFNFTLRPKKGTSPLRNLKAKSAFH